MAGLRAGLVGLVVMVAPILVAQSAQPAIPRVLTNSGLVEGVSQDGLDIFRGLPFAAPPVGDLRWRAPQPVAPWRGVRQTDAFLQSARNSEATRRTLPLSVRAKTAST